MKARNTVIVIMGDYKDQLEEFSQELPGSAFKKQAYKHLSFYSYLFRQKKSAP